MQPWRRLPPAVAAHGTILAGGLIVVGAVAAYHNTFAAAFVFDDASAILKNPTIRRLWPIWEALSPPVTGGGVCGRPLVNFSLAVNYALSGTDVWSYHALNLIIHVLAGVTLLGVARRTLQQPALRERFGAAALPLAAAAALIWTVHPLQTESVTFVVQRNEALVGLFFLLTLYGLIRAAGSRAERDRPPPGTESSSLGGRAGRGAGARSGAGWAVVAVVACLLGAASKEVIVTAPVIALLYDRTFLAGSFREAWRRRWALYLGLAGSWVLLGILLVGSANRGGTAGFGLGVSAGDYALTQCQAIVRYLELAVWPHPQVADYGTAVVRSMGEVWPQALLLLLAVTGTAIALWRRLALGFAGAWFFAILAPSSSVVPLVSQTMAEHRMYLPLAAVVLPAVCGMHVMIGRRSLSLCLAVAVALGFLTVLRNEAYRTELSLWSDTVAKRPDNARAHYNLGRNLLVLDRLAEAKIQFEQALRIQPDFADAHNNLGNALFLGNRIPEAEVHYQAALRLKPDSAEVHSNLGNILLMTGRTTEAIAQYEETLRLDRGYLQARNNLGYALRLVGRIPEAMAQFEEALRTAPDSAEAHNNLGEALLQLGRRTEAAQHFEQALRFKPDYAKARRNLERMKE